MMNIKTLFLHVMLLAVIAPNLLQGQPRRVTPQLPSSIYLQVELDGQELSQIVEVVLPQVSLSTHVSAGTSMSTTSSPPVATNIILKQILTRENNTLYEWFRDTEEGRGSRRDISVKVMDSLANRGVCQWIFHDTSPIGYQPVLVGGKMMETLEIAYSGWRKEIL